MSPPPYCTRLPPGSYSPDRRGYSNAAFVPSAPPAYDEISCHSLPRCSPISYPLRLRRRPRRSPSPRDLFFLWVCLILVPTVIIVGTLAVIFIASE